MHHNTSVLNITGHRCVIPLVDNLIVFVVYIYSTFLILNRDPERVDLFGYHHAK